MKKYLQMALLSAVIIFTAVSICGASVDRHDLDTALVILNYTPDGIAVLQPAPVWLPTAIIGGNWQDKPFELYVFTTGNTFQKFLAYDDSAKKFLWKPYTDVKKMSPLLSGAALPDYFMFDWIAIEDSSIMPQGEVTLNLCVDPKQDNVLDLTTAACGQATINVQGCTPTLKILPASINAAYTQGESMHTEQITVSDNCNNTYTLKEATGATWLTVTPAGLVTFTPGLTAKTYTANVDILNEQGVKSGTVPVTLTIMAATFTPPAGVITLTNMQEYFRHTQAPLTADYYQAVVPAPGGLAAFVSATKDWVTRRNMIVMYGGPDCAEPLPTLAEYNTIISGITSGAYNQNNMSGVTINNRKFYWDFSNPMNQSVSIWTNGEQKAPAGCYYLMVYNTDESHNADSSMLFITRP